MVADGASLSKSPKSSVTGQLPVSSVYQASAATAVGNALRTRSRYTKVRLFGLYRRHESLSFRAIEVLRLP